MSEAVSNTFFPLVEQAWDVAKLANDYIKNAGREVPFQELMEKVFLPSGYVNVEKTHAESGNPPKVFFKTPYGLEYRPANNNWIPFRHGPLTL